MAQFYQAVKEAGILTDAEFKKAQVEQARVRNSTFYSALKRAKVIDDEQLVSFSCRFFGMKRIGNAFNVQLDFQATNKVMGSVFQAIESKMFVLMADNKRLFVVSDPENETLKNKAASALGMEPEFALITEEEYKVILQYQLTPRAISEQADQIKVSATGTSANLDTTESASYTQKLLDMLIDAALSRRASDLHLLPMGNTKAEVKLRIDGELYHYAYIKADILSNLRNRLKTMSQVGGDTTDKPVEGQISVMHHGTRVDIRINIVHTPLGFDFVMRFIDANLKGLEELGLSRENYDNYMHLLHMTKGLVILCGPTGSGKTSLLYAGFKKLLSENKAVFTIEDPIEIILPGATQLLAKDEKGMTYAERFPSALRHDPDVIGIGETRKIEVAEQTVQAANTGHLVFTTLHTNDAVGAISRLTNLGLKPYAIGDVLAAVVAQRLVRRICTQCSVEYELAKDHPWRARYHLGDGVVKLRRGCGCANCAGTGYKSRISVNEFMKTTPELRNAIQKNCTRTEIEEILREQGFRSYIEDAVDKALQGITTFEEVDKLYADILWSTPQSESCGRADVRS